METYKCSFCGKEFTTKAGRTRHEKYCKQNPNAIKTPTAWNKGKTILTDERVAKQHQTRKNNIASGKTIIIGHKQTEETKKLLSKKRIEYLINNPDKHAWKRNTKFKSVPCEELKNKFRALGINFIEEYCPFIDSAISLDIAFPDIKIGIEVNGNQHYNRDGSLKEYYQLRHNRLEEAGWTIYEIHYTICYNLKNFEDILKLDIYNKDYVGKYFSKNELKKEKAKKIKQTTEGRKKLKNKKINQLKIKQIEERKFLILNSGINFTKLGWVKQVAKLLNISHKNTASWIKKHMPEFYSTCFVRKSPNN